MGQFSADLIKSILSGHVRFHLVDLSGIFAGFLRGDHFDLLRFLNLRADTLGKLLEGFHAQGATVFQRFLQLVVGRDRDALGEYGQQALAGLEADLQNKLIAAGLLVNSIIRDFDTELTDWNIKAQEVGIEVSTARLDLLDRTLEGSGRSGEAGTTVFVLAQDWQYWPFEGEYWLDEVDAFRGNLQSFRGDDERCFEYVAPVEE